MHTPVALLMDFWCLKSDSLYRVWNVYRIISYSTNYAYFPHFYRYEETYFTRLPTTKQERHRARKMTTLGTLGDELTRLGDLRALEGGAGASGSSGGSKKRKHFKGKKCKYCHW